MRRGLLAGLVGSALGCSSGDPCCVRVMNIPEGVTWQSTDPEPDGGVRRMTFVLNDPTRATVVYEQGGQRIEAGYAVSANSP